MGAAAVLAAVLVVGSLVSAHGQATSATGDTGATSTLAGIPQDGNVLGRPDAPVTLVEYADLQCPYCAEWSRRALPPLVTDYVKAGKLRIEFRGPEGLRPAIDRLLAS